MAEEDRLSTGVVKTEPVPYMPNIFGVDGEAMDPKDLKKGDMLVVFWKEPTKYKAEISIVCFEKFGEGDKRSGKIIFFSRAEFEPLSTCCYPLEDIREMRFCACDSSASGLVFGKLASLEKENRTLWDRLERIKKNLLDLMT